MQCQTFTVPGTFQLRVPNGAIRAIVEVAGAMGGSTDNNGSPYAGGFGQRVTGSFAVTPGQTLNIQVGGQGNPNSGALAGAGGFGGGGNGRAGFTNAVGATGFGGAGGGGFSRIQCNAIDVLIGGGGGGAGNLAVNVTTETGGVGGDAGHPTGVQGGSATTNGAPPVVTGGQGGSQLSGGAGGVPGGTAAVGSQGATGQSIADPGNNVTIAGPGGGGGGFFGGGSGGRIVSEPPDGTISGASGGGGGSSWFNAVKVLDFVALPAAQTGNGFVSVCFDLQPSSLPDITRLTDCKLTPVYFHAPLPTQPPSGSCFPIGRTKVTYTEFVNGRPVVRFFYVELIKR